MVELSIYWFIDFKVSTRYKILQCPAAFLGATKHDSRHRVSKDL